MRLQCIYSSMTSSDWIFNEELSRSCLYCHHHHHHHLFLKRPFVPRWARVGCSSHIWSPSAHPWTLPIQTGTQQFHVIFHTLSPILPAYAHTSRPCHHHISTGGHPVCSKCPNHLNLPHLTTSATLGTPEDCTNLHCTFCPSVTLHTSISPSYAPLSPDCKLSAFTYTYTYMYMWRLIYLYL